MAIGDLPPGATGFNEEWNCPRCGIKHENKYGPRKERTFEMTELMTLKTLMDHCAGLSNSDGKPRAGIFLKKYRLDIFDGFLMGFRIAGTSEDRELWVTFQRWAMEKTKHHGALGPRGITGEIAADLEFKGAADGWDKEGLDALLDLWKEFVKNG
jgi:hypothetical protein